MTDEITERQNLLSHISHELRTPLNSILGFSQLIGSDAETSDKVKRWAQMINASGMTLNMMVDSLVLYAAIPDSGISIASEAAPSLTISPRPFSALELLEVVRDDLAGLTAAADTSVFVDCGPALPTFLGCERYLRQAVAHLVSNAARYSTGSTITLSAKYVPAAESEAGALQIAVSDEGPGLGPNEVAQCFAPFTRGSRASGSGLGLGLTVAQHIARANNGDLVYISTPEQPSTFQLTIDVTLAPDV